MVPDSPSLVKNDFALEERLQRSARDLLTMAAPSSDLSQTRRVRRSTRARARDLVDFASTLFGIASAGRRIAVRAAGASLRDVAALDGVAGRYTSIDTRARGDLVLVDALEHPVPDSSLEMILLDRVLDDVSPSRAGEIIAACRRALASQGRMVVASGQRDRIRDLSGFSVVFREQNPSSNVYKSVVVGVKPNSGQEAILLHA